MTPGLSSAPSTVLVISWALSHCPQGALTGSTSSPRSREVSTGARKHNPHFPGLAAPFLALSTQDTPCSPESLALAQRGANSRTSQDPAGEPWRPLGHILGEHERGERAENCPRDTP